MDKQAKFLAVIGVLIFLVMIPIAYINGVTEFIPDLFIFIALTLLYAWMYDTFRMTKPILTLLIFGHVTHSMGIYGWYHISPLPIQWDHITHFFGALPYALLFSRFLGQWADAKWLTKKNLLLMMAIFLSATGVGAVVEISEFAGYLSLGFGDGAFRFGPGDGEGLGKSDIDIINVIGGGWINEGWDFISNTVGIVTGMTIMLFIALFQKKPDKAYYFEHIDSFSKKI